MHAVKEWLRNKQGKWPMNSVWTLKISFCFLFHKSGTTCSDYRALPELSGQDLDTPSWGTESWGLWCWSLFSLKDSPSLVDTCTLITSVVPTNKNVLLRSQEPFSKESFHLWVDVLCRRKLKYTKQTGSLLKEISTLHGRCIYTRLPHQLEESSTKRGKRGIPTPHRQSHRKVKILEELEETGEVVHHGPTRGWKVGPGGMARGVPDTKHLAFAIWSHPDCTFHKCGKEEWPARNV